MCVTNSYPHTTFYTWCDVWCVKICTAAHLQRICYQQQIMHCRCVAVHISAANNALQMLQCICSQQMHYWLLIANDICYQQHIVALQMATAANSCVADGNICNACDAKSTFRRMAHAHFFRSVLVQCVAVCCSVLRGLAHDVNHSWSDMTCSWYDAWMSHVSSSWHDIAHSR